MGDKFDFVRSYARASLQGRHPRWSENDLDVFSWLKALWIVAAEKPYSWYVAARSRRRAGK